MNNYEERVDPARKNTGIFKEHMATYNYSAQYVHGKKVLDLGCGNGYGTHFLSSCAESVTGVDISKEAVQFSKEHFKAENLNYTVMDATKLEFDSGSFDCVVSFEVLEHVSDYEKMIGEASRVLKEAGVLILATPNGLYENGRNPYHVKDFTDLELRALLQKYFGKVEILGQSKSMRVKKLLEGNAFKRVMRIIDPLGFRNLLITGALRKKVYHLFGQFVEEDIRIEDFVVSKEETGKAEILIARCEKQ